MPTLGHWFREAGDDTHYDGKRHLSHADLIDPATGEPLVTEQNQNAGPMVARAMMSLVAQLAQGRPA